jgi:nucleoid-associated protein YgaU
MPRIPSLAVLALCAATLLSACQTGGTQGLTGPRDGVTPNAVAGSEIEVTALEALPGDAAPAAEAGAKPAGPETAAPQAAPAAEAAAADPATDETAAAAAEPAPKPDLAATPVTPKSEMQLACEKKGGKWFKIGKGEKRACVRQTKDAGKRCERESQCDSVCLARSGTCAPFKPLYGCNEILQDNGARVTLCLE